MDNLRLLLIVVFCVALAAYIFVRSRRLGKQNKK
jgi:hypothetical protein